jgi:REP element-mobilizing transposase RayT
MPVYLFTFHAYRSWMPDRGRGYVRRDEGILPPDEEMAAFYEEQAKDEPTVLNPTLQRILIEELIIACGHQKVHLYAGTTEPSHVHSLVGWRGEKGWLAVRNGLKSSLSRRLTKESTVEQRLRLSEGASRKHVKDREHFDYLVKTYLPRHRGVAWYEDERRWVDQSS